MSLKVLEKTVVTAISEIKADIKELLVRTKSKESQGQRRLLEEIPFQFPLNRSDDLQSLEAWIQSEENRKLFVSTHDVFAFWL